MTDTYKIAVTGAAGQIGYSLLFRIASGQLFGPDVKIHLSLLEIKAEGPQKALQGVAMELDDCAFPTLAGLSLHDDAAECFADATHAFLVGARPRSKGMERKDLLEANAAIFSEQGRALDAAASRGVKVLVVGNPANTNCLIAKSNAPGIDAANFTAMTRLDQNRALAQVAQHTGRHVSEVRNVIIWGNHSATQFPDIAHATVGDEPAAQLVDDSWYRKTMIEAVQKRGAAIIDARGLSSAASAASAAIDHMRDWSIGTPDGVWASMGVFSGGEYDVTPGLVYSYPCICLGGRWQVIEELQTSDFAAEMMQATERELVEEREAISSLLA